jgi:uncharacterized protein YukE
MTRQIVILDTSVTVPDPASVTALAGSFGDVNGCLAELEGTLQTLTRPDAWGDWTGLAADAFGRSIGQLPGEVEDIRDAYGAVVAALREYAGQLEPVIAALTSLSYRAEEAEGTLIATRNARDQAIAQGHNPLTTGWDARLEEATAAVTALRSQLSRLVSELDGLASTCTRKIAAAEPKLESRSLFSSLASDFINDVADPLLRAADAVARADLRVAQTVLTAGVVLAADDLRADKFVAGVAADVVEAILIHPLTKLSGDVAAFIEHPTAENLGAALGDVAGILGVLALIPGVDVVAVPLMLAASAGAAEADWIAVAEHESGASVLNASLATVTLGLGGLSYVAGSAADASSALSDGDDAQVAGTDLWKAGLQQKITLADVKGGMSEAIGKAEDQLDDPSAPKAAVAAKVVSNQFHDLLHFDVEDGEDGTPPSPAVVRIEHVKWASDVTGDVVSTVQDKLPAESKKS